MPACVGPPQSCENVFAWLTVHPIRRVQHPETVQTTTTLAQCRYYSDVLFVPFYPCGAHRLRLA